MKFNSNRFKNLHYAIADEDLWHSDLVIIESNKCRKPTYKELVGKRLDVIFSVTATVKKGKKAVLGGKDTIFCIEK